MNIAIFGLGYVGFTAACCIASEGHKITGIDVSEKKVAAILEGKSPIIEPSVDEMLKDGLAKGLIDASTSIGDHLDDCDLAIVCVGTPSAADGSHNMGYIADVTRQIAAAVKPDRKKTLTVAYRSTIRPGSVEELIAPIFRSVLGDRTDEIIELVYNPEFLRESSAVQDYFEPPKIVIGTSDGKPNKAMEELNANIKVEDGKTFYVGFREAEFTKFVGDFQIRHQVEHLPILHPPGRRLWRLLSAQRRARAPVYIWRCGCHDTTSRQSDPLQRGT